MEPTFKAITKRAQIIIKENQALRELTAWNNNQAVIRKNLMTNLLAW